MPTPIHRRAVLASAAVSALAAPRPARAQNRPLRIGVLGDFSNIGRANSGPGSVEAAHLAVEEFGSTVLGRPIEVLQADHQQKPDVGLQIARQWIDTEGVSAIADIPNSSVAFAVTDLARARNRVALVAGAGSSELTNRQCSPNTVHFGFDTYALAKVATQPIIAEGGTTWFFIAADYTFGAQLEADARRFIGEAGGAVLGNVKLPVGTPDFASALLQAQASGAKVLALANAGEDTSNALKQAAEFGLVKSGQRIVSLELFITDIEAAGLETAQGAYFATASYWNMTPKTRAWSKQFFDRVHLMPTMSHTSVYGSVLHYLKGVREAGTDQADQVMAAVRSLPISDAFIEHATLRADGRVMRPMYLGRVKTPQASKGPWDDVEILKTVPPEEAFRPISESVCPLLRT